MPHFGTSLPRPIEQGTRGHRKGNSPTDSGHDHFDGAGLGLGGVSAAIKNVPASMPTHEPGFMPPQHQSAQQPAPPQFACGGGGGGCGGGSSVMGLDQAALAGAAAQAMGVDPGAASAMGQVATGMAMNYLGSTASATR